MFGCSTPVERPHEAHPAHCSLTHRRLQGPNLPRTRLDRLEVANGNGPAASRRGLGPLPVRELVLDRESPPVHKPFPRRPKDEWTKPWTCHDRGLVALTNATSRRARRDRVHSSVHRATKRADHG